MNLGFYFMGIELARITRNQPLYIAPGTPLDHNYIYYLERERNQSLTFHSIDTPGFFIFHPGDTNYKNLRTVRTFPIDYDHITLHLGKR